MNWVRISTDIQRDPSLHAISDALGIQLELTLGLFIGVLTSLPSAALDGDVSDVSDATLERWAGWTGKRGKFAEAFRAELCTPQGVVRSWNKYNGTALRRLEDDRDRKRAAREAARLERIAREMSAGHPQDVLRTVRKKSATRPQDVQRYETRRDETRRDELQTTYHGSGELIGELFAAPEPAPLAVVKASKRGRPAAAFPHFPDGVCAEAFEVWQSKAGAVPFARFRKAFGPLFTAPEASRPVGYPRDAELVPAVTLYLAATFGTAEARFRSPERCAQGLSGLVRVLRDFPDAERQLSAAAVVLGVAGGNQRRA